MCFDVPTWVTTRCGHEGSGSRVNGGSFSDFTSDHQGSQTFWLCCIHAPSHCQYSLSQYIGQLHGQPLISSTPSDFHSLSAPSCTSTKTPSQEWTHGVYHVKYVCHRRSPTYLRQHRQYCLTRALSSSRTTLRKLFQSVEPKVRSRWCSERTVVLSRCKATCRRSQRTSTWSLWRTSIHRSSWFWICGILVGKPRWSIVLLTVYQQYATILSQPNRHHLWSARHSSLTPKVHW